MQTTVELCASLIPMSATQHVSNIRLSLITQMSSHRNNYFLSKCSKGHRCREDSPRRKCHCSPLVHHAPNPNCRSWLLLHLHEFQTTWRPNPTVATTGNCSAPPWSVPNSSERRRACSARGTLPGSAGTSAAGTSAADKGGAGVPALGRPAAPKPVTGGLRGQRHTDAFLPNFKYRGCRLPAPCSRACRGCRRAQGWQCQVSRGCGSWASLRGLGL